MSFELSSESLDPRALALKMSDPRAGACVTFEGWVRNHNDGRPVRALEYEAFAALATTEGCSIVDEAKRRFDVLAATCVHRVGSLQIGDLAVWVGVSAAHRGAAFEACRYIIDQTKARVPIWKKEHYLNGSSEWVNCASDTKSEA
jgi:molybdopterin synthase catalytic subunit